jgi:hypothetical protein
MISVRRSVDVVEEFYFFIKCVQEYGKEIRAKFAFWNLRKILESRNGLRI